MVAQYCTKAVALNNKSYANKCFVQNSANLHIQIAIVLIPYEGKSKDLQLKKKCYDDVKRNYFLKMMNVHHMNCKCSKN